MSVYLIEERVKSFKLSFEPITTGMLLWKKTEHKWIVLAAVERTYGELIDGLPEFCEPIKYKVDEEILIKCFSEVDKGNALRLLFQKNKELAEGVV